jgi:hypothetical protein
MDTGWVQAMNTSALYTSIIALTAMVASPTAQAADETLTLACQGTVISSLENAKPEPVSMGIIVNFTNRTVQGFDAPDGDRQLPNVGSLRAEMQASTTDVLMAMARASLRGARALM